MKKIGLDIGHCEFTWEDLASKGIVDKNGDVFEEFHFNLAVGKKLKNLLDKDGRFEIISAQPLDNTSRLVTLSQRVSIYNKNNVDVVLSIHANAHANQSIRGHIGFYWHNSVNGKKLAKIWDGYADKLLSLTHDRNLILCKPDSWTDFYIVRYTKAPALLTEFAFFTNEEDRNLLNDENFILNCAETLYYSLCDYFGYNIKIIESKVITPMKIADDIAMEAFDEGDGWIKEFNNIENLGEIFPEHYLLKYIRNAIEGAYNLGFIDGMKGE